MLLYFFYCDARTCLFFFFIVYTFVYHDARTCNDPKLIVFVWETMCSINACQQNVNDRNCVVLIYFFNRYIFPCR
jgi:hypothetical protein